MESRDSSDLRDPQESGIRKTNSEHQIPTTEITAEPSEPSDAQTKSEVQGLDGEIPDHQRETKPEATLEEANQDQTQLQAKWQRTLDCIETFTIMMETDNTQISFIKERLREWCKHLDEIDPSLSEAFFQHVITFGTVPSMNKKLLENLLMQQMLGNSSTDIYCKEVRRLQPSVNKEGMPTYRIKVENSADDPTLPYPIIYEIDEPNWTFPELLETLEQLEGPVRTFRIFPIGHTWQCKVNEDGTLSNKGRLISLDGHTYDSTLQSGQRLQGSAVARASGDFVWLGNRYEGEVKDEFGFTDPELMSLGTESTLKETELKLKRWLWKGYPNCRFAFPAQPHGRGTFFQAGCIVSGVFTVAPIFGRAMSGQITVDARASHGLVLKGTFVDDVPVGFGETVWNNGDRYEGERCGCRHGKGTMTRRDGYKYTGDWYKDKKHGQGEIVWPGGETFVGELQEDFLENGILKRPYFADSYEGEFETAVGDLPHGKGKYTGPCGYQVDVVMNRGCIEKVENPTKVVKEKSINPHPVEKDQWIVEYEDGSIYEGPLKNGKRDGIGKLKIEKYGYNFHGSWLDDLPVIGEVKYSDSTSVQSKFEGGVAKGETIIIRVDGTIIAAKFEGWNRTCESAVVTASNGDIYRGALLDEKFEGKGTIVHKDGSVFEGTFVQGQKQGPGKLTHPEKGVYEGSWENGKKTGMFTIKSRTSDTPEDGVLEIPVLEQGEYLHDLKEGYWHKTFPENPDRVPEVMYFEKGKQIQLVATTMDGAEQNLDNGVFEGRLDDALRSALNSNFPGLQTSADQIEHKLVRRTSENGIQLTQIEARTVKLLDDASSGISRKPTAVPLHVANVEKTMVESHRKLDAIIDQYLRDREPGLRDDDSSVHLHSEAEFHDVRHETHQHETGPLSQTGTQSSAQAGSASFGDQSGAGTNKS